MSNHPPPPAPKKVEEVAIPPPPLKMMHDKQSMYQSIKGVAPPQAIDLERAVLGAILIDFRSVKTTLGMLESEVFFKEEHRLIFKALKNLFNKDTGIDLRTVSHELRRLGTLNICGGDYYLVELSQKVASTAHIEFHCAILLEKYILRELIAQSSFVIEQAYHHNPDVFNMMDVVENGLASISQVALKKEHNHKKLSATEELQQKVDRVNRGETAGVITHIREFDEWGGGFRDRELIVIAGRPGMGKTTAILSICANASFDNKIPIAFFSLEMSTPDLKARLAAKGLPDINYKDIRDGKLSQKDLDMVIAYYNLIDESALHIVDGMNQLEKICNKIRELVKVFGIKMAVIDYVQLVELIRKSSNRTDDLNTITRTLKALANELNMPIVILAQLSRSVDDRPSKRPILKDLKQSGSIEEDADTVIFLLRMAYYQEEEGITLPMEVIGKTEMIIAKGRNTGTRSFWTFLDFYKYDWRSL